MVTKLTPRQKDLLVRTTLGEAGGEDAVGQAAVMHVIMNRAMDGGYGKSLEDVMLAPKQFSTWNEGAGGNSIARGADPNSDAYKRTLGLVERIEAGGIPDMTQGATHYISDAGMKKLVDDGHQTNLMPKWWGEQTSKRGGDGNGEWVHGGHRFTGRRKGWEPQGTDVQGAPIDPIATTNLDTGQPIFEDVIRRQQRAALSENEALWGEGVSPEDYTNQDWYFAGGSGGGYGRNATMDEMNIQTFNPRGGVLDQSKTEPEPTTFMGKFKKWATPDRADMLLALGSGMLSSDGDIFEQLGEGGAALSKESARQQGRDMEQSQFETKTGIDLMKHRESMDLANAKLKADIEQAGKPSRSDFVDRQVVLPDGTEMIVRMDKATGRYLGPNDDDVTDLVQSAGAKFQNNSTATGDKWIGNAAEGYKRYEELQQSAQSLTKMDEFLDDLADQSGGGKRKLESAVRGLQAFFDAGLSQEQVISAGLQGRLSALAGENRVDITGGGTTSDKDMEFILSAIGGDINSWLWNPQVAGDLIGRARENKLNSYNAMADNYDLLYKQKPEHFVEHRRYTKAEKKAAKEAAEKAETLKPDPRVDELIKKHTTPKG